MKIAFLFCCLLWIGGATAQTGKVGIGTNNPKAQLHTTGSLRFDTLRGFGARLVYVNDSGALYTPSLQNTNVVPVDIPDNNCSGITSSIIVNNLPTAVPSGSIRVRIDITHVFDGDLVVFLISPAGQILALTYAFGSHGDNFTNTVFGDSATQLLFDYGAPFTGFFKPLGNTTTNICTAGTIHTFGAFGGGTIVPNGTWTLKVLDIYGGFTGRLNNWSIAFDNTSPLPLTNALTANNVPKATTTGTLINSQIYDNGNVGIGTSTPIQKLDVAGNINAIKYNTAQTGAASMAAAAYGNVFSNATNTINNSSGNCSLSHIGTGQYLITFTGSNLSGASIWMLPVVATLSGNTPGFITFNGSSGLLYIYTFNTSGALTDMGFGFAVYKP